MKKQECLERLSTVGGWISNADSKIATGLGIFSFTCLFIGFIFTDNFDKLLALKDKCCWYLFLMIIIFSLSLILFIVALLLFICGIIPRLSSGKSRKRKKQKKNDIDEKVNFWFFKHVAGFPDFVSFLDACISKFGKVDFECEQILEEVYANSCICLIKMRLFKWGVILSFISIFLSLLSIMMLVVPLLF